MTSELKPCPFCGWDGELIEDGGKYYIECENSACPPQPTTPLVDNVETAVEDWNTRAVPDVPDLVRYYAVSDGNMMKHDNGLYVLYDQAAAMLDDKDEMIMRIDRFAKKYLRHMWNAQQRAEAAEANLSFVSSTITDIANELGCNPYNEEILQTIFDMKSKLAEYEDSKNE